MCIDAHKNSRLKEEFTYLEPKVLYNNNNNNNNKLYMNKVNTNYNNKVNCRKNRKKENYMVQPPF